MVKDIKSEKLKEFYTNKLKSITEYAIRETLQLQNARKFDGVLDRILKDRDSWDLGWDYDTLLIWHYELDKTKFSERVREIAEVIGETPDIVVEQGTYKARFETVTFINHRAPDCKIIEEEETRKVFKPHPECIAALQELEQL